MNKFLFCNFLVLVINLTQGRKMSKKSGWDKSTQTAALQQYKFYQMQLAAARGRRGVPGLTSRGRRAGVDKPE